MLDIAQTKTTGGVSSLPQRTTSVQSNPLGSGENLSQAFRGGRAVAYLQELLDLGRQAAAANDGVVAVDSNPTAIKANNHNIGGGGINVIPTNLTDDTLLGGVGADATLSSIPTSSPIKSASEVTNNESLQEVTANKPQAPLEKAEVQEEAPTPLETETKDSLETGETQTQQVNSQTSDLQNNPNTFLEQGMAFFSAIIGFFQQMASSVDFGGELKSFFDTIGTFFGFNANTSQEEEQPTPAVTYTEGKKTSSETNQQVTAAQQKTWYDEISNAAESVKVLPFGGVSGAEALREITLKPGFIAAGGVEILEQVAKAKIGDLYDGFLGEGGVSFVRNNPDAKYIRDILIAAKNKDNAQIEKIINDKRSESSTPSA